jgi:hypothetical protein
LLLCLLLLLAARTATQWPGPGMDYRQAGICREIQISGDRNANDLVMILMISVK